MRDFQFTAISNCISYHSTTLYDTCVPRFFCEPPGPPAQHEGDEMNKDSQSRTEPEAHAAPTTSEADIPVAENDPGLTVAGAAADAPGVTESTDAKDLTAATESTMSTDATEARRAPDRTRIAMVYRCRSQHTMLLLPRTLNTSYLRQARYELALCSGPQFSEAGMW
jgi:hypothetical protein